MSKAARIRLIVLTVVAIAVVAGGGLWWVNKSHYESTDNAYVQAETVSVTPQIEGYVAEILVADNQPVQAGQILVRLDPADATARLNEAVAKAEAAEAAVRGIDDRAALEQAVIAERAAGVSSAKAAADRAGLDLKRYGALAQQGWVSDQRLQETRAGALQSDAAVAQARAALEAERRTASGLGSSRAQMLAQAQAARAAAQAAKVALDRTVIRAPVAGVVGARAVRPGQFVRPGGAMMAIVPVGDTYVIANFKETQVARLHVGQPVDIHADAFGKAVIHGKVESFAPATGSEFALIPVENAVGNFTKIAQRLPVRIAIDKDSTVAAGLRPGLSVKVKVDVTSQAGQGFAQAMPPQQFARTASPQVASQTAH